MSTKLPRIIVWGCKPSWPSSRKLKNAIAEALPNRKVLLVGSNNIRFKQRNSDTIINYGNSNLAVWYNHQSEIYNQRYAIKAALHKITTFSWLQHYNIPHVEWTTSYQEAQNWVLEGHTVLARDPDNASGGKGITIVEGTGTVLPNTPLYTKYKKKKHEFRVHVFLGKVIDTSWKRKRKGEESNSKIRNFKNGWVYCREGLTPDSNRDTIAINAVKALGLDFGAVDMIYNEKENQYYVLEVNTAPGLTGTTLTSYVNSFVKEFK